MATTAADTEIANYAISHLGISEEIGDLATENSDEANAIRRFYDLALEDTLRSADFGFATREFTLGLVEENPNDEYRYSYRYPSDVLFVRKIQSGIRNDNRQTRVHMKIMRDDDGLLIYTDIKDPVIYYIKREDNVLFYPSDFVLAFSYKLAYLAAARLTGGDPFNLGAKAQANYLVAISGAAANSLNEAQSEEDPESEYTRARDSTNIGSLGEEGTIYPTGFTVT